ncbi:MAG TPA: Hpt domain-containing protein, partial [Gammaproteobacteria bacterium]
MNEAIDYSTLRWVKQELDDTLNQARQALEAYVQNPDDQAQMSFCAAHLHQVFGTLQMVELYGASLLAEEMEQVAKALLDGGIRQPEDAHDVLMRSMLQLPDYLERLMRGGRDIPLVLLPLLNDLRAVRGENLLSENAMFSPDLSRPVPDDVRDYTGEDVRQLAKSLRHQYQVGLLAWYREQNTSEALQKIGAVLQRLQRASGSDATARLWWLAGGLVEAMRDGALEVSLSTKLLMGQIDRQLKKLIDGGEQDFEKQLPTDLQKNLLFYIAHAEGPGPGIEAIQKTYQLKSLLPDHDEVTEAQDSMSGHNLDLLQTVAVAVKENLARVKDGLDLFQRSGCEQLTSLQPVADTLKSLGDTLGMLGLGAPRKAIMEKAELTRDIIAGKYEANESTLMDIASALLFVENSLDGVSGGRRVDAASAEDAEFDQVMVVVLQEAISDMARAKDAITGFMDEQDVGLLKEVPQLFNQVKGGLLLLGREKAAALVDAVGRYVARDLIERRQEPDADTLDALADAICGVEYYLEGQKEKRLFGASVIDVAVQAVARLGYPLPGELLAGAPEADQPVAPIMPPPGDASMDAGQGPDSTEYESVELEELSFSEDAESELGLEVEEIDLDAVTEEDALPGNVVVSDRFIKAATPQATITSAAQSVPVVNEDIDEEIMEIFIEEAEEEVATIGELLPRWLANAEDQEALITVRRSFHTLKGSGRLVGALLIGEFSWAFENLLNRLIDGTRELNADMIAAFETCLQALPQLVEQVKGGPAPSLDIALLQAQADALARTGSLDDLKLPELEESPENEGTTPADTAMPAEDVVIATGTDDDAEPVAASIMDPVLYEIFYSETETHLATIRGFIAACHGETQACHVSEALVRALHTLHGSARMAEAGSIAAIASGLERYAKIMMAEQRPMPEQGIAVLEEGVELVSRMLALFKEADPSVPDTTGFLARVAELSESSMHERDAAPPFPALVEMGLGFHPSDEEVQTRESSEGMDRAAQATTESAVDPEILEVFA